MTNFRGLPSVTADGITTSPDVASLPTGMEEGAIRYVIDVGRLYTYDGSAWIFADSGVLPPSPATTTDNAVARWDGVDGTRINNSVVTIGDTGVALGIQINADGAGNAITNIENADIKAAAAIDATKIADGSVTNTEFQYISTLTSNAQTQLGTKLDATDGEGLAITGTSIALELDGTTLQKGASGVKVNHQLELTDGSDTVEFFGSNIADIYVSTTEAPFAVYTDNVAQANPAAYIATEGTGPALSAESYSTGPALKSYATDGANLQMINAASGAGSVSFTVPADIASHYSLEWPGVTGTGALVNDGAGELGWQALITDHTALSNIGTNTHAQIDTAVSNSASHIANTSNPHSVTKAQVGLTNVDDTSDATKNAASVTLTNKTLTSPVINTPTGIVKGDVGLGNVDNTSNATERAATATLTNKAIDGNSNTLTVLAGTQLSGQVPIANGGTGTTTAQLAINALAGAVTDNRVLAGDGSNIVLKQIDDPAFFTSGATGTPTTEGVFKKNRWQQKFLASDFSTNSTITDLSYTLEAGKTYRFTFIGVITNATTDAFNILLRDDGVNFNVLTTANNSASTEVKQVCTTAIHTMTGTAFTVATSGLGGGATLINGNGTVVETHMTVEELNDYDVTAAW